MRRRDGAISGITLPLLASALWWFGLLTMSEKGHAVLVWFSFFFLSRVGVVLTLRTPTSRPSKRRKLASLTRLFGAWLFI